MRAIELTEQHRSMLLEMCKKLFPEYEYISLDIPEGYNKNHAFVMGYLEGNDYVPNCDLYIHWFEFVHTHLFLKIINLNGYMSISDYISMNRDYIFRHPVEYCYEQFKRL